MYPTMQDTNIHTRAVCKLHAVYNLYGRDSASEKKLSGPKFRETYPLGRFRHKWQSNQ